MLAVKIYFSFWKFKVSQTFRKLNNSILYEKYESALSIESWWKALDCENLGFCPKIIRLKKREKIFEKNYLLHLKNKPFFNKSSAKVCKSLS